MNPELKLRPQAGAEIAAARDWYDESRPGLGTEFVHAVNATLVAIQQNPYQYQTVFGNYRRAGLRRFPYGLIYILSDREIIVVACIHGRRHPRVWQERT